MSFVHDTGIRNDRVIQDAKLFENYKELATYVVTKRVIDMILGNPEFAKIMNAKLTIGISDILDVFSANASIDRSFGNINTVSHNGMELRLYNIFQTPNTIDVAEYYEELGIPSLVVAYMILLAQYRATHTLYIETFIVDANPKLAADAKKFLEKFPIADSFPDDCTFGTYVNPKNDGMIFIVRAVSNKCIDEVADKHGRFHVSRYRIGGQEYRCWWRRYQADIASD